MIENFQKNIYDELKKKYSNEVINELLDTIKSDEQKSEMVLILNEGKIELNDNEYIVINKEIDSKELRIEIAKELYNIEYNKKIDNPDYDSIYEMKKKILQYLLNNNKFVNLEVEYSDEALKILKYILKNEKINENSRYVEIHDWLVLIENISKYYPENSFQAVKYFIENGKEMLPIYKEVYKYLDYYSETGAKLDYSMALKITIQCKKSGILDPKIIRNRLSYTELNSLFRILFENGNE